MTQCHFPQSDSYILLYLLYVKHNNRHCGINNSTLAGRRLQNILGILYTLKCALIHGPNDTSVGLESVFKQRSSLNFSITFAVTHGPVDALMFHTPLMFVQNSYIPGMPFQLLLKKKNVTTSEIECSIILPTKNIPRSKGIVISVPWLPELLHHHMYTRSLTIMPGIGHPDYSISTSASGRDDTIYCTSWSNFLALQFGEREEWWLLVLLPFALFTGLFSASTQTHTCSKTIFENDVIFSSFLCCWFADPFWSQMNRETKCYIHSLTGCCFLFYIFWCKNVQVTCR